MKIVLLTWLCGPRAHVAKWVVLGSFIPRPILWDSDISSIRVKWILLKSNFRFSKTLSLGEPLQSRWSPTAPEDFEDTLRYPLETLCPLLLQFPATDTSLWITTYTCHHIIIARWSCYYKIPWNSLYCSKNRLCHCLSVLCHLNTPKNSFSHLSSIRSSQLFRCFKKVFEILFNPPKILSSFIALQILVY